MRRYIVFIPLAVFVVMGGFLWKGLQLDPTELPSARLNQPVPAFSLQSLYDQNVNLNEADLRMGEPVLLNVWATWCPSCKQEHAQLNKIAQRDKVKIIGVNYKDDRAKAKEWLVKYLDPYALNIYDPKGSLGLDLGVYGAPETYVIDGDGVIRYKHVGVVDERVWQTLKQVIDGLKAGDNV